MSTEHFLSVALLTAVVGCGGSEGGTTARNDGSPAPEALFQRVLDGEMVSDGALSRGVAWGDLEGDGTPDLVVANTLGWPQFLYRNDGGASFTELHETGPTLAGGWTEGAGWIDADGDGDLDLFLTQDVDEADVLFRNDGTGLLEAVDAGDLTADVASSRQGCWADFDADGDADVYVARGGGDDDALYENLGGLRFRRLTVGPWIGLGNEARTCGAADADGDGLPEIYVGNFVSQDEEGRWRVEDNLFFKNRGGLRFERVEEGPHVTEGAQAYGISWIDYDYDDDLDLFVTNIGSRDRNLLFENDGQGDFRLRDDLAPVRDSRGPSKGHTWGDYDLDGDLDLFVANGTEGVEEVEDYDVFNFLYLNRGDGSFERVSRGPLVEDRHVSAGTAWADVEGDGDLDLFVANWGGSDEDNDLYLNRATERADGSWIAFRLRDGSGGASPLGARVRVLAAPEGGAHPPRWQTRSFLPSTGYASQNQPIVHFGLGLATVVDSVEVRWPDGAVESFGETRVRQLFFLERDRGLRVPDGA